MTTTTRRSDQSITERICTRIDTILQTDEKVVIDLHNSEVRDVVRCRALAYASRYLRSVFADQAADLLDDQIVKLGGGKKYDSTQIGLATETVAEAPSQAEIRPSSRSTMMRVSPAPRVVICNNHRIVICSHNRIADAEDEFPFDDEDEYVGF
jgi:hypothetical protein